MAFAPTPMSMSSFTLRFAFLIPSCSRVFALHSPSEPAGEARGRARGFSDDDAIVHHFGAQLLSAT